MTFVSCVEQGCSAIVVLRVESRAMFQQHRHDRKPAFRSSPCQSGDTLGVFDIDLGTSVQQFPDDRTPTTFGGIYKGGGI